MRKGGILKGYLVIVCVGEEDLGCLCFFYVNEICFLWIFFLGFFCLVVLLMVYEGEEFYLKVVS